MNNEYKCPLEMKIFPQGAGWTDISWFVPAEMSEPLMLTASYIGHNMSDFARALYYFYPNQFETGRAFDLIETVDCFYDIQTERHGNIYKSRETKPQGGVYKEFPIKAEFHFDEEPEGSYWTISREPPDKPEIETNFPVHVHICVL